MPSNNKYAYASSYQFGIGLHNSVASSATFVAGRQSDLDYIQIILGDNLNYELYGFVTVGTSPVANTQIRVYCWGLDDDIGFPDTFSVSDNARTLSSVGAGRSFLKLAAIMRVDTTTSDKAYSFGPINLGLLFGGVIPQLLGLFVTHNTGVVLNTTSSNHGIFARGLYSTNG